MEQLFLILQQIYGVLDILNSYLQDEREELVVGYQHFLFEINNLLKVLDRIVEGSTPWGWKIEWGYQPWKLRTHRQQKGLTLQAGWEDRVDFGLDLYQDIPIVPQGIPVSKGPPKVLTPVDLNALEVEANESEITTDTCKVCHIQHERLESFHEFIPKSLSKSSSTEDCNEASDLPVIEEGDELHSMPELEMKLI